MQTKVSSIIRVMGMLFFADQVLHLQELKPKLKWALAVWMEFPK